MARKKVQNHTIFHYLLTVVEVVTRGIINSILWVLLGTGGVLIFLSRKSPFDIVFGLPMALIGLGFSVNSLGNILLSIFSWPYNKGMCRICS